MFLWHSADGLLEGMLVSHVDDFVYCGTEKWHKDVMDRLYTIFKISNHSQGSFKYTGLNVVQTNSSVVVNQYDYIASLVPIEINSDRASKKEDELTVEEKAKIRSIGGQLLWVTTQTRPDAAYDSCWVSNYGKNPTVRKLLEANKAVKKLQMTKSRLLFPDLGDPRRLEVVLYKDAAHANLPSGASQGGNIIFLMGKAE